MPNYPLLGCPPFRHSGGTAVTWQQRSLCFGRIVRIPLTSNDVRWFSLEIRTRWGDAMYSCRTLIGFSSFSWAFAQQRWLTALIRSGALMDFRRSTAAPVCRQWLRATPEAWRHVSRWITTAFIPIAARWGRWPRMWRGDALPKAAPCECGKILQDIARTCCCPTSKTTAWRRPQADERGIGALSSADSDAQNVNNLFAAVHAT